MFIAVRTNDGTLLYANGYSRSSYNVFSYREIFDGDDTKAIEFIKDWNKGESVPTHVRPLEYGAIVVDFQTKQILHDSYYDTNINLMSNLAGGSFIGELIALERTRTASDEELVRPVYDLEGNLWDGVGDNPDEGVRDKDGWKNQSYADAFFIDYSPWVVRCYPETRGGRIAFLNAVEACGFPVRRDLWENRSCETEHEEARRVKASSDIKRVMSRLARKGVNGGPLWSIDDETGAFTANIILKFRKKDGTLEHILVPIELSGDSELTPISRTVGAWYADETIYTNGVGTFSDRDGDGDSEMIPYSKGVPVEDRLDLFASLLLGAGSRDNRVLEPLSSFYENGNYADKIPFTRMTEVDLDDNVWTADVAETDQDEIESARKEAERRLRKHWAVHQGHLLGYARESFWGVLCRSGVIEVGPSIYSNSRSGNIYGCFGVESRAEAFAYANRLLELGCGSEIKPKGENQVITAGSSRAFVNHGEEIHEMADALVSRALGSIRQRDGQVDRELEPRFREISDLMHRHRHEWTGIGRTWPLEAEWKALWEPLSAALGEVTPEKLGSLEKPKRSWDDPARFWRLKAALDLVTFPERLAEMTEKA
jgi:hypothetical protein